MTSDAMMNDPMYGILTSTFTVDQLAAMVKTAREANIDGYCVVCGAKDKIVNDDYVEQHTGTCLIGGIATYVEK